MALPPSKIHRGLPDLLEYGKELYRNSIGLSDYDLAKLRKECEPLESKLRIRYQRDARLMAFLCSDERGFLDHKQMRALSYVSYRYLFCQGTITSHDVARVSADDDRITSILASRLAVFELIRSRLFDFSDFQHELNGRVILSQRGIRLMVGRTNGIFNEDLINHRLGRRKKIRRFPFYGDDF